MVSPCRIGGHQEGASQGGAEDHTKVAMMVAVVAATEGGVEGVAVGGGGVDGTEEDENDPATGEETSAITMTMAVKGNQPQVSSSPAS